jgi:hypothetical protein
MSNTSNDATAHYAPTFKAWPVKLAGPKPANELLEIAHAFGKPGKQSLALAMCMRDEGATGGQIYSVCSAPQNNHRRGLIEAAYMKRVAMPKTVEGHTVYKIEVTPKGKQAMARVAAKAEKLASEQAVKPADKPKVKKAKGTAKAKKATSDRLPVVSPVDGATGEPEAVTNNVPAVENAA